MLPTNCENVTDKSLSNITVTDNDIGKIIQGLNPNKTRCHDTINILMLKLCRSSIYKPLPFIFRACLDQGIFPLCWKKARIVSYHRGLISQNQSGFKPDNSFINQLLSVTHEICKSFDDVWVLRGVFLLHLKSFWQSLA